MIAIFVNGREKKKADLICEDFTLVVFKGFFPIVSYLLKRHFG